MLTKLQPVLNEFSANVRSTMQLAEFDGIILKFAIAKLRLALATVKAQGLVKPIAEINKCIEHLTGIRTNDSLSDSYNQVRRQCIVLLVSYFEDAVGSLFKEAVAMRPVEKVLSELDKDKEKRRFTPNEVAQLLDDRSVIGKIVADKRNYNFQDMQSVAKAFKECCDHEPERDRDADIVVVAQAWRHVIVHKSGKIDERFLNQTREIDWNELGITPEEGKQLEIPPPFLQSVGESMKQYLHSLAEGVSPSADSGEDIPF